MFAIARKARAEFHQIPNFIEWENLRLYIPSWFTKLVVQEVCMADLLPYEEARKRTPPPDWWEPEIDRSLFRDLQKRNNYRAFISHGLYFLMMVAVGWGCAFLYQSGSYWCIPAFLVYGQLFGMCNSRVHESLHGTPFKTGFLNEIVYWVACAMEIRCPLTTRWSHFNHHSYTILTGMDLEIQAPRPVKLWKVLLDFFYLYSVIFSLVPTLVLHSLGISTRASRHVVPPPSSGRCSGRAVSRCSCTWR